MTEDNTKLIKFPCDFSIKVMGKSNSHFEEMVMNIVLQHYPDADLSRTKKRHSPDNNFLAITVTVEAENQAQLDALYKALTDRDEVLFAL